MNEETSLCVIVATIFFALVAAVFIISTNVEKYNEGVNKVGLACVSSGQQWTVGPQQSMVCVKR